MTYGDDQRLELLERGLCEVASILAGMAKDRATVERLTRITSRYELPEGAEPALDSGAVWERDDDLLPWESSPPDDDPGGSSRPS